MLLLRISHRCTSVRLRLLPISCVLQWLRSLRHMARIWQISVSPSHSLMVAFVTLYLLSCRSVRIQTVLRSIVSLLRLCSLPLLMMHGVSTSVRWMTSVRAFRMLLMSRRIHSSSISWSRSSSSLRCLRISTVMSWL